MGLVERFFSHFAHPRGFLGRIAGYLMSITNRDLNEWVVSLLDLQPGDKVLEIGCGPGVAITYIIQQHPDVIVLGIDLSPEMVREAMRRNAQAVRAGRVVLRQADVGDPLPFDTLFDKVFSVNSFPFWNEPVSALRNLRRSIKPGGCIALAVQPRDRGATDNTARERGEHMASVLRDAGFADVRAVFKVMKPVSAVCVLAVNPPS